MTGPESACRDLLERGVRAHRAGRLEEAETLYKQALEYYPGHPDALHLAGVVALQKGDGPTAISLIVQAARAQPRNAPILGNLAQAYLAVRDFDHALDTFQRARHLDPPNPQFAAGAAACLAAQGRLAEAEQQLRELTRLHPRYALAWLNLANAVREQARLPEAVELYRHALQLDPALADGWNNLGHALHQLEKLEEAAQAHRQHLALRPDAEPGYCNLASVLVDQGRFADAAAVCEQGLARLPASTELQLMLGAARVHDGRPALALAALRAAADRGRNDARCCWAYGLALFESGRVETGLDWLQRALDLQPDSAELREAMATVRLATGDLQPGWDGYEWRAPRQQRLREQPGFSPRLTLPDALAGRTLLLLGEQGLGDQLFFLRFAPALQRLGARLAVSAHPKLASLLARALAPDRVVAPDAPPPFDAAMLIGDLPRALGQLEASPLSLAGRADSPAPAPAHRWARWQRVYFPALPPPLALAPLAARLDAMRARLAALGPPPYLGVTWRAGTAPERQRGAQWSLHKAVALDALGDALRPVCATWVALQRHPRGGEIEQLARRMGQAVHDLTTVNEDLEDMLALLALLDDYVAVSNTNVHLRAGAGRGARVLVPRPAEWRWMKAGAESPWFPGFPLYRQRADGDWSGALARLARDLQVRQPGPAAPVASRGASAL